MNLPDPSAGEGDRAVPSRALGDPARHEPPLGIELADLQSHLQIERERILEAVACTLRDERVEAAQISVAVVDDRRIHAINRDFLRHDQPTDVISFELEDPRGEERDAAGGPPRRGAGKTLSGEVVVSAETALRVAREYGWPPEQELLLYVVHGVLHLCGYDDLAEHDRSLMRQREAEVLELLGIEPRSTEDE